MPVQTIKKANVYFPDGARVLVKAKGDTEWFDVGAINSAVTATLNWTESTVETANAGQLDTRISNMEIAGGFTLINLNPEGVGKMSGGVFEIVDVEGEDVTPEDFVIAKADIVVGKAIKLVTKYNGADVEVAKDADLVSSVMQGEEVVLSSTYAVANGMITFSELPEGAANVVVKFKEVATVEGHKLTCGSSTQVLSSYAMRIEHEDENGKIDRALDLYSVFSSSGGFQFNFKGANEDGIEEMPLTFTARLDTARNNKDQLMNWYVGSKDPTPYV